MNKINDYEKALEMIKSDISNLNLIDESLQDKNMAHVIIDKDPMALKSVRKDLIDKDIAMKVVAFDGWLMKYVPDDILDQEIVDTSFIKYPNIHAIQSRFQSPELCMKAIEFTPYSVSGIAREKLTVDIIISAVASNGLVLKEIPADMQNYDICRSAILSYPMALQYVNRSALSASEYMQLCMEALNKDTTSYKFIPDELKNDEMKSILEEDGIYELMVQMNRIEKMKVARSDF